MLFVFFLGGGGEVLYIEFPSKDFSGAAQGGVLFDGFLRLREFCLLQKGFL